MTVAAPKTIDLPPEGAELVNLDPELVVIPDDNPPHSPAMPIATAGLRAVCKVAPAFVAEKPGMHGLPSPVFMSGQAALQGYDQHELLI
jgi:hypothetical protein